MTRTIEWILIVAGVFAALFAQALTDRSGFSLELVRTFVGLSLLFLIVRAAMNVKQMKVGAGMNVGARQNKTTAQIDYIEFSDGERITILVADECHEGYLLPVGDVWSSTKTERIQQSPCSGPPGAARASTLRQVAGSVSSAGAR